MLESDVALSVVRNDLNMLLEMTRPDEQKVGSEGCCIAFANNILENSLKRGAGRIQDLSKEGAQVATATISAFNNIHITIIKFNNGNQVDYPVTCFEGGVGQTVLIFLLG